MSINHISHKAFLKFANDEIFKQIVQAYKDSYNYDLSHMKLQLSDTPTYNNGKPADIPVEQWGGNWVRDGRVLLNKNLKPVAKHYKFKGSIDDLKKQLLAHELAHEIEMKLADKTFKKQILDTAHKQKFTTEYLDTLDKSNKDNFNKELFCEYLAKSLLNK